MRGTINGRPTKEFFVNMITRDITIQDAILDLLDNSIDGAKNKNEEDFQGLFVKLTLNKDHFIVEDNCGGFSLEIAKKYAFRFGRPTSHTNNKQSIGRFGVGMKRALFKMGKTFEVESKTADDHFQVRVDVDEWKNKNDSNGEGTLEDWSFSYNQVSPDSENISNPGTFIKVEGLYKEVSDQFEDSDFMDTLHNDIERVLIFSISKGLKIYLNGKIMKVHNIHIFNDKTKPIKIFKEKNEVSYRLFAGLGETGKPRESGWYIFCNDRLVLEANRNEITTWEVGSNPRYTNDFAMFRGVLFINSDETINLPLTTTKKGVDTTSESYRYILPFMKDALWTVTSFLKKVKKLDKPNEYRSELGESESNRLNILTMRHLEGLTSESKFIPPDLDYEKLLTKDDYVRIAFYVKRKLAEELKTKLDVKKFKSIGEEVLNYYLKMEEIDHE
jgi:hypothetical protein